MWLLAAVFRKLITVGTLTFIGPDGTPFVITGREPGPAITVRIADDATARAIALHPRLKLGEAYMAGKLTVVDGDIYDFLDYTGLNSEVIDGGTWLDAVNKVRRLFRRILQYNPIERARRNVAHHYDLSGRLYDLFLDPDRQYSCAYFPRPGATLEEAQEAKKRHIAAKLLLEPGQTILDIGSGWGGLGMHLARAGAGRVVGVTLSEEQHKLSNQRARDAGLADRVQFKLQDYRLETDSYDRIVSVGMFEHVGVGHYREYFSKVRDLLKPDGVALIHSIGRSDGPGVMNAWVDKYIFPGAYAPALSEVLPIVEQCGLVVTDIEILRLHYAETLREWRRRFLAARQDVLELYDERFLRMWEFYLASCEVSFRRWGFMVWQMQLARRVDSVPMTRDYIQDWERKQAKHGAIAA
ncbi:MAG: class I SAM-dependent methyltransferase [Alphaproteobacteria bacterium]|nr:class I SAM-dependent methyltransferase [Alphaproteobacteria bacterium]